VVFSTAKEYAASRNAASGRTSKSKPERTSAPKTTALIRGSLAL
jgi:hypothetical protein